MFGTPKKDPFIVTAQTIARTFKEQKVGYAVYGSVACLLHGVEFKAGQKPGDIDISVNDFKAATDALSKNTNLILDLKSDGRLVKTFKIKIKGSPFPQ